MSFRATDRESRNPYQQHRWDSSHSFGMTLEVLRFRRNSQHSNLIVPFEFLLTNP